MIDNLKPGTQCFLVGLTETYAHFCGRTVEVVGGPDDAGEFEIAAPWLHEYFEGRPVLALRRNLMPITPDRPRKLQHRRRLEKV